jgi:phage recombination protein Bet
VPVERRAIHHHSESLTMNAVTVLRPGTDYTGAQLALIKRTVARDTNGDEFDLFMSVARMKGLDPFSKQISAIVFNKDKPDKRNMSIITTIDGMRAMAARSNRYRPDEDEPLIEYDAAAKNPQTNPLGIVKAVVKIHIADALSAGGWKPVTGFAYWDEFAPIKDEWAWDDAANKRKPTGKQTLDGNWPKMGRVMICKCAEAQALRKAFPEDLSGLYEGSELDRAQLVEITASEAIGSYETEERLQRIGGVSGITFQLTPASPLESIPLGQIADRIFDASADFDLTKLRWFESANTHPLREFWARSPGDALAVKKHMEDLRKKLEVA